MHLNLSKQHGFTLIELMVTIAIGGILLAVGIPSFQDFIAKSKVAETNNALVHSLQLARSASMERLEATGVCVSNDPMADDATCSKGASYNKGWLVYVDTDGNGERGNNEDILDRGKAPGASFTFTPSAAFEEQIYFNDSGASTNVAGVPISGTIGLDYSDGLELRLITVSANGRVSTEAQ